MPAIWSNTCPERAASGIGARRFAHLVFSQIAEGIGEETWLFHLRRGDYSYWLRASVKDNYLADQAERVEQRQDLEPAETRRAIRGLIEARYTLPK
jgi:hypothetical protein